jgi:hypothetical protein
MDIVHSVKIASKISQFIDLTTKIISTVHNVEQSNHEGAKDHQEIKKLTKKLLECTEEIQFKVPEGVSLLSEDEDILRQLCQGCQKLSLELLADLERFQAQNDSKEQEHMPRPTTTTNGLYDSNGFQQRLEVVNKDLCDRLAPLQWLSINHLVRELAGKNSRFKASRTKDITDLTSEIDVSFLKINSIETDDDKKPEIWSQILSSVQKAMEYSAEQVILGDMQFWSMNRREDSISKEHENTFDWIFSQKSHDNPSNPSVNFTDWLIKDEPLYWISGKPGSGKSTLMKYIANSPKTIECLNQWAGGNKLVTASFYFWSSARDPLQKSGSGLLRSILFQILCQHPEMIQHAFPYQWKEAHARGPLERFTLADSTTNELLNAYQRIANLLSTIKVKFCFFIDGLDEYEGNSSDIIRLVNLLSKSQNMKTCISSRPWKDFESSFGGSNPWKLYVHELTQNDMRLYVENLLNSDNRFRKIKETDGDDEVQDLVKTIVQNAEGVFLWVFLVIRSLLDGLTDTNKIKDLHHKLSEIPKDLDKYFEKMLLDIDESLREQTAHTFLITLLAVEKLPLLCYWFIENNTVDSIMGMKLQSLSKETAVTRLNEESKKLKTQCKVFLTTSNMDQEALLELEEYQWLFQFRVDFLHRTVADFLRTADMQQLLTKWSANSFNADLEICKAALATIKTTSPTQDNYKEPSRMLSNLHLFFSHAKFLEGRTLEKQRTALIDEVVSSLKVHNQALDGINGMILGPGNYWSYEASFDFAILYHCVSYGLGRYVCLQLESDKVQFPESPSGLLSGCLTWDPRIRPGKLKPDLDTIQQLLQRGLNPNTPWGDRSFSFWQLLLNSAYSSHLKGTLTQIECDAIKLTTDHGVNLEDSVEVFGSRRENKSREILEKILPREQFLALQGSKRHH